MDGITMQFSVQSAGDAARAGRLNEWIQSYLRSGTWANAGLADGLQLQQRYWRGPIELSIVDLQRTCGPEPTMPFRQPIEDWNLRVQLIAESLGAPKDLPPLIAESLKSQLFIRDGNHRHEALLRAGYDRCWVLIWYNSSADHDAAASL